MTHDEVSGDVWIGQLAYGVRKIFVENICFWLV